MHVVGGQLVSYAPRATAVTVHPMSCVLRFVHRAFSCRLQYYVTAAAAHPH